MEVYNAVEPKFRQEAIKELRRRIEAGEDVHDILQMDATHDFYIEKIVAGLMPISWDLYNRIMKCDDEDNPANAGKQ